MWLYQSDKADIAGEAAHVQQNAVKQTNLYIENYQTAEDWECYGSSNSHNTKLLRMVSRMHNIFLHHPTEPTIAGAVAVALHSDGQHDASLPSATSTDDQRDVASYCGEGICEACNLS